MSYCAYCALRSEDDLHRKYHDERYGFPVSGDNELFGRLIMEINQAGLSWDTILKKEDSFRKAYVHFDIRKIADFNEVDEQRLLSDAGIIRNRLKIKAAIHNAKRVIEFTDEFGSFEAWLTFHHPKSHDEWNKLFKKTFKFVGAEIVKEFLMSTGYLSGAHNDSCPIFEKVKLQSPKWMEK